VAVNLSPFSLISVLSLLGLVVFFLIPIQSALADRGAITIEGYDVDYDIIGGTVLSVSIDTGFVELIVDIESFDDGTLQITIPRPLLDAKFEESDDDFFVIVDGFEADFIEISSNTQSRTLLISFFLGERQIEILGTHAILSDDFGTEINIPTWVKNNAGWWAAGQIGDSDFISGIQYLIKEGIMDIPATESGEASAQDIPDWVKNNAGWWADGLIGDSDFVSGIQYLVTNGIMRI